MKKPSEHLKIEYLPIDELKPFADNPRQHSERNINDIKRSIARFGWTNPILVRREDNMVIAGHGRIEAAKIEGLKQVPVIYLDMSANDAKLYSIADNRTAETSEWNLPALDDLIQELDALPDIDLRDTGFELEELDRMHLGPTVNDMEKQPTADEYLIIVECDSEDQQTEIFTSLDSQGYKCRVLIS